MMKVSKNIIVMCDGDSCDICIYFADIKQFIPYLFIEACTQIINKITMFYLLRLCDVKHWGD